MARPKLSEQAELIVRTLRHMKEVQRKREHVIFKEYDEWCVVNGKEAVSSESVRKWGTGETIPLKPGSFYDFALTRIDTPDPRSAVGMLAQSANQLFPSGNPEASAKLARLVGDYEVIRRLWTPAGSDDCIRCKAEFKAEHGVVVYRQEEKFPSDYQVDETYEGYTFMFGQSFWILASEAKRQSLKFMTIHECAPTVSASADTFDICKGNLIAVSGRGPNFSHRFILKKRRGNIDYGIVEKADAFKIFDRSTLDYLYKDNGT